MIQIENFLYGAQPKGWSFTSITKDTVFTILALHDDISHTQLLHIEGLEGVSMLKFTFKNETPAYVVVADEGDGQQCTVLFKFPNEYQDMIRKDEIARMCSEKAIREEYTIQWMNPLWGKEHITRDIPEVVGLSLGGDSAEALFMKVHMASDIRFSASDVSHAIGSAYLPFFHLVTTLLHQDMDLSPGR